VGFGAGPAGAAIFGHYGDRIGRKRALIATLLLMDIATFSHRLCPRLRTDRHLGCDTELIGSAALFPDCTDISPEYDRT
jgi:MFS family permease